MSKNIEELREYLDEQEARKRHLQQSSQDRAEMQGAFLAIGLLLFIITLLLIFVG